MPNRLMLLNAISGQGNPTRSIEVNTLIKKVKKKEVRKEGKGLVPRLDVPLPMLSLGGCKVSSGRRMMYFAAMVFRAY